MLDDPFNPNNWTETKHEFRIYSGTSESIYAVVDEIDYHEAIKHKWTHKVSRGGKKIYLKRIVETQIGKTYKDENGKRISPRGRVQNAIYLHIWIMKRKGDKRPTRKHKIVHHKDGYERNCQRDNLEWETLQGNAQKAIRR